MGKGIGRMLSSRRSRSRTVWDVSVLASLLGVLFLLPLLARPVVAQAPLSPPPPGWFAPFLQTDTHYVTSAEFLLEQSADTTTDLLNSVYNGEMVTYTLRIENLSATTVFTDIEITDLLPTDALEQDSISCSPTCQRVDESETVPEPSGGTVVISTTRQLIWEHSRLEAGEAYTVSFSGRVVGQSEGTMLTNRVFARYFSDGIERAASSEDLELTALVRVPSAGGASISAVPTWFSKDAGGTIAQDWGDFDLDGDLDLALGSSLGTFVYRNDAGVLTLIWQSPLRPDDAARLSYGVRWADVVPDPLHRPELIVVGDSEQQGATDRGLNYVYAYDPNEQDFVEATTFTSHLQLVRLVTADFDGDGDVDLVGSTNAINGVVETPYQTLCPVNLYRNDGLGQFTGTVGLTETHAVRCVSEQATAALGASDYDGDGDIDLALGEFPSNLKLMENVRDGQVLTNTDVLPPASGSLLEMDLEYLPYDLAWADYDDDGLPELAAAYPLQRQARIYDQAGGVFGSVIVLRTATFMTPLAIDWGDFNGDGRVDLAVADASPRFYAYVPGHGFQHLSTLDIETSANEGQIWSLRGIELSSRQNLDLAVSNRDGPSRLYTASAPKLATTLTKVSDRHASSVAWGDADGNGDQDLLLGSAPLPELSAYLYLNKNGTFSAFNEREFTPSGFGPHAVAFGDVDLDVDGLLEIAIGTPTAIQIYHYQDGTFNSVSQRLSNPNAVRSLAWGDANDDGRLDLLAGFAAGPVQLYLNAGSHLESTAVFSTAHQGEARAVAWGDFDGDYYLDFAVGFDEQPLTVYRNNGDETFSLAWTSPLSLPVRALALGDYDNDGDLDLAVGNGPGAADQLWENDGSGAFGSDPIWISGVVTASTTAAAWGDWENDGTLDLALGRDGEADVVYANLGSRPGVPQFAALWTSEAVSGTTGLAWGDPDGDGDLDLAVSHRDGASGYYENMLITPDTTPLTDNPPYVYVKRPGSAQDSYFYSSPEIVGGPGDTTVTVPYVVYDPESDPISQIWFEYSLSGGTEWQPATPASSSPAPITQTTPVGTPGAFVWNAAADDAVSDNARFRVRVTSQKSSGPLQDISGSGISPPFRVRGLDCYWPAGASIVTDPITATAGDTIDFKGRVAFANGPVTYHWDFGDGETADGWKAQHVYTATGRYAVALSVYGEACPIARPAFTTTEVEISELIDDKVHVYLPLVSKDYAAANTGFSPTRPAPLPTPPAETDVPSIPTVISLNIPTSMPQASTPQAALQLHTQDRLQLTNYALGINNQPAISGEGTRVAFWSTGKLTGLNPDGNIEIFLAEIGESNEIDYTQITSSTGTILGGFNLYPAIDHDGDRIVFFSDRDLTGGNSDRNFEIFLAEIQDDGTPTLTQITYTEDGINILPDISSDGRFITFVSDNDLLGDGQLMSGQLEIFRAEVAPNHSVTFTQITDGTASTAFSDTPVINGNGELVTFVSDRNLTGNNEDGNQEIFVARVAPDGDITYRQVTTTTAGLNEQPDLSDDGTRLVYLSTNNVAGGNRHLYRAEVDPTTLALRDVQLLNVSTPGDLDRSIISGDGTRVAYYTVQEQDVYVYDIVDGQTKESTGPVSTYPSLSSGGTQLAFASEGKIYVKSYPLADLALRKTSVITEVASGERLTYTLTLTNSGPSAGTDVVLTDELPDGVTSLLPQSAEYTTTYPPAVITDANRTLFELPDNGGDTDAWTSMDDNQSLLHFDSFVLFTHPDDGRPYLRTFDTSGRDNHFECPLVACPSQTTEGKMGNAPRFHTNDFLHSEDPIDLQNRSFSISFWAKRDVANRGDWIAGQGTIGINRGLHLGFRDDNRFTCAFFGDDLNTRPYEDTGWHHWACTYDAGTRERTIYRDGVAVAQDVANAHYTGSGNFLVGSLPWAPEYFNGMVDEFAIYHRVLSPEAIHFQHAQQAPEEAAVFDSQVFTETLGLGLWGALQWHPGQISGEPLPDNQGADAYPPAVTGAVTMTDNLMLLHLDEPDGASSFLDASGSANDASCDNDGCPQAIPGLFNGALRFDGENDTVDLPPYFPDAEDFTFAAWVYWNGGDLGQHIFDLGRDQGNRFYLSPQGTNGQLRFAARRDGNEEVVQSPALPVGSWMHLAVTVEGDTATIWLNGDRLNEGTMTHDPQDVLGEMTWLGQKPSGEPYFHGRLDEVAVFARALTADEIRNHYLRGATQIAVQVRTCDDPGCDTEPFVGLDGSRVSALTALDDAASELPTFALRDLSANPYLQYRVFMSNRTALTSPSLISATVQPQMTCRGRNTVICQVGTEAAPLPPNRTLTLTLPTQVGATAYHGAGQDEDGTPIITNTAYLKNQESDHEPNDNETAASTYLESVAVNGVIITGLRVWETGPTTPFTATVAPETASPTITYTWEATNLFPPIVNTGWVTDTVDLSWASPGTKIVTVTAVNEIGQTVVDTHTLTVEVRVSNLTVTNNSPTEIGTETAFSAKAGGTNITYEWDFGDGSARSFGATPTHTYPVTGTYTAIVTASNSFNYLTDTTTVTVTDVAITDLIVTTDSPTELGQSTTLTASIATGSNVRYTWDFGDGDITTTQAISPATVLTHAYAQQGSYTVVVTATNSTNTVTTSDTVTITDVPITGLTLTNDSPTEYDNVTTLTATLATGTNVSYTWDFGDGTTEATGTFFHPTTVSTTHVFSSYLPLRTHTVVVTATNTEGSSVLTTTVTITRDCWADLNGVDYPTLQAAIDAAATGETVKVAGTCAHLNDEGGLRQVAYIDRSITVRGGYTYTNWITSSLQTHPTTIDASGNGRGIYVIGAVSSTIAIESLRIVNGNPTGLLGSSNGNLDVGGGLYAVTATVTISGCEILDSDANRGGGIYLLNTADAGIINNYVAHNTATGMNNDGAGLCLVDVQDVWIAGNTFTQNAADDNGGAIALYTSTGTLANNEILSNTSAHLGGGIHFHQALDVTLRDNVMTNNTSADRGGGLYAWQSTLTVLGSLFSHNSAGQNGGGMALRDSHAVRIEDTHFQENTVDLARSNQGGGGLYLHDSGQITLTHSTFLSNTSNWDGGGLYAFDTNGGQDLNLSWQNNRFQGNEATWGAAALIRQAHRFDARNTEFVANVGVLDAGTPHSVVRLWNLSAPATLTNTLIADNRINDPGGAVPGMRIAGSTATLLHTTLVSNTGGDGVGIRVDSSNVTLINSIIASQTVGIDNASGTATVEGVLWHDNGADIQGTVSVTDTYTGTPDFIDPAAHDYHLGSASEAIDRGLDAGVIFDIDGDARDANPDLGCDEYSLCYIRLNDDPLYYPSIQAAVDASTHVTDVVKVAGTCSDVTSRAAPPGYNGATDISQLAYLSKTLTIQGGYAQDDWTAPDPVAHPTTLNANRQGRVLFITGDVTPTLEYLQITGGDATGLGGGITGQDAGGGVFLDSSRATLRANAIFANRAAHGGGLYINEGAPHLYNTIIVTNTSTGRADGLYAYNATPRLGQITFADNADEAMYATGTSHVTLTNTIVASHTTGFHADPDAILDVNGVLWFGNTDNTAGGGSFNISDDRTGNPRFVAPGSDYHIRPHSAAVDTGVPTTIDLDIDGETRPTAFPDLGADEIAGLRIAKDGPTAADIGAPITYTLTVTNTGIPVSAPVITDTLPDNANFVRASDGGTLMTDTVRWDVNLLAAGQTLTRTFTVTASQSITNVDYAVTANETRAEGTTAVTTTILPTRLQIIKRGPAYADPNSDIVYTLTVTNTGSQATGLVITDTVPNNATYKSGSASHGGSIVGNVVRWEIPILNRNHSATRTFTVRATQTITNDDYGVTANSGAVRVQGTIDVTTIITPVLEVSKDGPSTADPEELITYTLTVINIGGLATGVSITDRVPSGATYIAGGTFADPIVTCDVGDVPYQQTAQCTFTVTATQTITNDDYRAIPTNGAPASGTDTIVTTIAPTLSIMKAAPYSVTTGSEITFTLSVTNTGGLATDVIITDAVPLNASFIRAAGSYSHNTGVLTWTLSTPLSYATTVTRTFVVTATETITNAKYGVTAKGGYRAYAPMPVVVRVE